MKFCMTVMATTLAAFAVPAAASAASLKVEPSKGCYGSGEQVSLIGSGFAANQKSGITITKDGERLGDLTTDARGMFNGTLTLGQANGRRTSTYTAADSATPPVTASAQITVSEVDVRLRPQTGAPGRRVRIGAVGFTKTRWLWAHVARGRSVRTFRIGRLKRACHKLVTRRRLLPPRASVGVYTIQFDNYRHYRARRPLRARFKITVRRGVTAASSASVGWSRLF